MSNLSPTSPPTSATHPSRAPPPSLFLGPPSRNASNISLPPSNATSTSQSRGPLLQSRAPRGLDAPSSSSTGRNRNHEPQPAPQTEVDRTDALWAEMQATLAEVELSAFSSTHVFGSAHSAALDELRDAQIELAKAWGRGEAEDEEAGGGGAQENNTKGDAGKKRENGEEDEEGYVKEARRRREANERFFGRVGEGVAEVVEKLDGVAQAMAKVERESREIWSGSESMDSESVST